jgi:predicted esterase
MAITRRILVLSLCFLILCVHGPRSSAQSNRVQPSQPPDALPTVDFLATPPVIDGLLDDGLRHLPRRTFSQVDVSGTDENPVDAHYRLAYGTQFLYVYVEAQGDALTYNDRAYQNGDGFQLLIGRPMPGNEPTREFYVAVGSAVNRPELDWTRRLFWYFNVDKIFVPMSSKARLESAAHGGVISFEFLLPWQDLHPYHPWLSEAIGFNLGFVKAAGAGRFYYRVLPDRLGAENQPRRYVPLRFAEPALAAGIQSFVRLDRNHLRQGEGLAAESVTLSARAGTESVDVSVLSGEGTRLQSTSAEYPCQRGLTRHTVSVRLGDLPSGGYRVAWNSRRGDSRGDDSARASGLTLLPAADLAAVGKRIETIGNRVSPGSLATFRFLLAETAAMLRSIKPYETAANEELAFRRLEADLAQAEDGRDVLAERTGLFRRAFRSDVDGTLQPYAVRIPAGYDPHEGKKYGLIVFLHGSASDETSLAGHGYVGTGEFIELAPRGRGPSNGFSRDHAQEDIEEAIAAVRASYPVDEKRIILTGFSMGGYGVYRTYYQHPERYRALAVFSGLPALRGSLPPGTDAPNFLEEPFLGKFSAVPIFVFHGRKDANCPIAATEQLVNKLRGAGANVEFVTEEGAGHQRPDPGTVRRYHEWLQRISRPAES